MILLRDAMNVEEVEAIFKDPELFERIAEDGIKPEDYVVPFDDHQKYLMIMNGDDVIGVWSLYPTNRTTLRIHCNILMPFREHGKEAGLRVLQWFVDECPRQYQKLNAEIPVIYPEVYHFTKNFGFHDEGINRKSILKKGEIVDQYRLGITRDEVAELLK